MSTPNTAVTSAMMRARVFAVFGFALAHRFSSERNAARAQKTRAHSAESFNCALHIIIIYIVLYAMLRCTRCDAHACRLDMCASTYAQRAQYTPPPRSVATAGGFVPEKRTTCGHYNGEREPDTRTRARKTHGFAVTAAALHMQTHTHTNWRLHLYERHAARARRNTALACTCTSTLYASKLMTQRRCRLECETATTTAKNEVE